MFNNVRSISSGTCENSQYENIDYDTCSTLAASRDAPFRTVSNSKYASGCVQVGDSVYYNNAPIIGGSGANDAVQQLCMLPTTGKVAVDRDGDAARGESDRMFDGTWLDKSIVSGLSDRSKAQAKDGSNTGYFPVNIRTIQQAVFYVNP